VTIEEAAKAPIEIRLLQRNRVQVLAELMDSFKDRLDVAIGNTIPEVPEDVKILISLKQIGEQVSN